MLNILKELFYKFEENDIRYLHWKGNNHFMDGCEGNGDVDILIHEDDYDSAIQIMNNVGFKRFITQSYLENPYMEDWLALDDNTGKMVHFHLHKKMVFGLMYVNEYSFLPYEECFVSRVHDCSIYIQNPVWEYVLLLCRIYVKNIIDQRKIDGNMTYLRKCLGASPSFDLCDEYSINPETKVFLKAMYECNELSYTSILQARGGGILKQFIKQEVPFAKPRYLYRRFLHKLCYLCSKD